MVTSATITTTTAANWIPEIWSGKTLDAREEELVMAKLFDTTYAPELRVGDTVNVGHLSNMTAQTKTSGLANTVSYEATTETVTQIIVNTHIYAAFLVEKIAALQSKHNIQSKQAQKCGYALAEKFDTDACALVASYTQNVGTLNVPLTDANIRRGVQYLDDAKAPKRQRYFVFGPAQKQEFWDEDKYVNQLYRGDRGPSALEQGKFGTIYGMDWQETHNVTANSSGHDNAIFHKEVVAAIMQQTPETLTMMDIDRIADAVVVHEVYGLKEMRDDHGVWMKGK